MRDRAFLDRGVYQQVLPPTQNVTIINVTNNVTNYTVVNEPVVNSGIAVANVERAVGRRVPRVRTVDVDRADAPRHARAGEVAVFRPEVRAAPERRPAQGRSLVKGDEPPPLLAERRKQREQERKQKGSEPDVTAKDVAEKRPAGQPRDREQTSAGQPRTEAKTQQQKAQRQREQKQNDQRQSNQQQLDQQRAAKQDNDAQAQADKQAKDAQKEAKDNPKGEGKKNPKEASPSPTPPPAGQQQ